MRDTLNLKNSISPLVPNLSTIIYQKLFNFIHISMILSMIILKFTNSSINLDGFVTKVI